MGTALAHSEIEPHASLTLSYYAVDMVGGNGAAYIDFSVGASKFADEIGVDSIRLYKSNGSYVRTVRGSASNGLILVDSDWHSDRYGVPLSSGFYYAEVTVFATVGSITDSRTITTSTVWVS